MDPLTIVVIGVAVGLGLVLFGRGSSSTVYIPPSPGDQGATPIIAPDQGPATTALDKLTAQVGGLGGAVTSLLSTLSSSGASPTGAGAGGAPAPAPSPTSPPAPSPSGGTATPSLPAAPSPSAPPPPNPYLGYLWDSFAKAVGGIDPGAVDRTSPPPGTDFTKGVYRGYAEQWNYGKSSGKSWVTLVPANTLNPNDPAYSAQAPIGPTPSPNEWQVFRQTLGSMGVQPQGFQ